MGGKNKMAYDPMIKDTSYGKIYTEGTELVGMEEDYLKSLEEQTKGLAELPSKLKQAFQLGKSGIQSQAAQALAGARAARGGRGLAAARQSASSAGGQVAKLEADSAIAQQQAQQEFLKAKTAETAEKKKVAEAESLRAAQIEEAKGLVQKIIDEESGVFVTTEQDIENMKARFRTEIATKYAGNPAAINAALALFNSSVGSGKTTEYFGGTY